MIRLLTSILCGALFGAGLALSGMTNPAKVVDFLDPLGTWDPSLALVMAGAMGMFFACIRLAGGRTAPLWGGSFPPGPKGAVDRRLLVGAALFGSGWGIAGFCPGPALVNAITLRPEVLVFLAAMVVGMLAAQRVFGADSPV